MLLKTYLFINQILSPMYIGILFYITTGSSNWHPCCLLQHSVEVRSTNVDLHNQMYKMAQHLVCSQNVKYKPRRSGCVQNATFLASRVQVLACWAENKTCAQNVQGKWVNDMHIYHSEQTCLPLENPKMALKPMHLTRRKSKIKKKSWDFPKTRVLLHVLNTSLCSHVIWAFMPGGEWYRPFTLALYVTQHQSS